MPPTASRLLRLAALLLALLATASSASTSTAGRVILVAREEIVDRAFRGELEKIGGPGASRFVLALSEKTTLPGADRCFEAGSSEVAGDRELCRKVAEVDVLVLRGGTFMQWFETLFPDTGPTHLHRALLDRVRSRKTVIAYGGASAFLSNGTSIPSKDLDEVERNPRRRFDQVARVAMALGPRALIDSDDLPEGTPFRLLRALWWTRVDLGFHLVGDVALDYRREGGELIVLGPGQVIACDLGKSRRQKRSLREARLSVLQAGDGWDFVFDRPVVASDKERTERESGSEEGRKAEVRVLRSAPTLARELEALASSGGKKAILTDGEKRLEIAWDRGSEAWGGGSRRTLLRLAVDCFWK